MKLIPCFLFVFSLHLQAQHNTSYIHNDFRFNYSAFCNAKKTPLEFHRAKKYYNSSDSKGLQLSLRMGYHTGFKPSLDNGFVGGIVYDINAGSEIIKGIYAGFGFDYGTGKDINYSSPGYTEIYERDYKYSGFKFEVAGIAGSKPLQFYVGAGLGRYSVNTSSIKGANTIGYLNLNVKIELDYIIFKNLALNSEVSYYSFISSDENSAIFNFKMGPKFLFNL